MFRSTFVAAAFAVAMIQPVFAEDAMKADDAMKSDNAMMMCDDASMMKMQTEVDAATDESMKMMAMKEMDAAKEAMKANKTDECTMHMDGAMKALKG